MDDLKHLIEEVLRKARFNLTTVREVNQTKIGDEFEHVRFDLREESATFVTAAGLRRYYRNSKRGWGTKSRVEVTYLGNGQERLAALAGEVRSRMCEFVESSEDIVGHALCSIPPTGRMSAKTYPSQLVGLEVFSNVPDLAEALVIAGGCIGADSAIKMLSRWHAGRAITLSDMRLAAVRDDQ